MGFRAGRGYWRSAHDHLYALELADLGRERPSMAMVYGHWDRYEPRPPEHEIDVDLLAFSLWVAEVVESLNPADCPEDRAVRRHQTSLARGLGAADPRRNGSPTCQASRTSRAMSTSKGCAWRTSRRAAATRS